MTEELNRRHNLATMPTINNNGESYIVPFDIYKEGYDAYDISNWFKGRVGDNGTPFGIRWYKHGQLMDVTGMRPFIEGQVGDYTIDDSDPDNPKINMDSEASNVHVVGEVNDCQEYGVAIYRLINQAMPQSGIFYGKIGVMGTQDDGTTVMSSVDVVFKVLAGHMNMLGARKFYVSELEKAWLDLQTNFKQYDKEYDAKLNQELSDLNTKIANEIKRAEDTLGDTQSSIDNNLAALKRLSASVGALQAQLDADNLETQAGHFADIVNIKRDFDQKLSNIKHPTQAFESLAQLQAKYPNGADGDFVTTDTGHIYIYSWAESNWKDCGAYQGTLVADNSVDGSKIKRRERATTGAWNTPLIVDFKNGNLIVPDGYHKLISYPDVYSLNSGTVPIITENAKTRIAQQISSAATQAEKDQLAKTDLRSKSGGLFVALDPNGINKLETQFKFYDNQNDIPQDEVYLGFIQWPNISSFVFPSISTDEAWLGNETNHADAINKINAPRLDDYLLTFDAWIFDWENASITVPGYAGYQYKGLYYPIKADTYKINLQSGIYGYFIYLELDNNSGKWILTFDTSSTLATTTKILFGWIELDSKTYDIPAMPLLNYMKPQIKFYGPNYPKVDWDNEVVHFPVYWHILMNNRDYANSDPFDISFKGMTGGYFVIDENSNSNSIKDMIKVSDDKKITYGYTCNLGFFDTATKTFDFYGLNNNRIDSVQSSEFPWQNKAVTCLGDSITQGDSGEGGLIPSYVPRMQKWLQTVPTNAGVCGALITDTKDGHAKAFVNRLDPIQNQDVVTIFGGINDFQWNAPLGKMSDSADTTSTFFGALKHIVVTLSKQNPKAKLMFITPMKTTKFQYHTFDDDGNLMKNANGNTQLDFVNAIKQVADYYSIPVLDMYSSSNYSPYIPSQVGHDNFTADGLHPTAHGYERIAQTIAKAINEL